jgi:hypothetical protein
MDKIVSKWRFYHLYGAIDWVEKELVLPSELSMDIKPVNLLYYMKDIRCVCES